MEGKTFICKFCNKDFSSGKSLGGHIRIHNNESNRLTKKNKRETVATKQQQQGVKKSRSDDDDDDDDDTETTSSTPPSKRFKKDESVMTEESNTDTEISQDRINAATTMVKMLDEPLADDNDAILSDGYSSDSDYFINGPKKSDTDEFRVNEGGSSTNKRVLLSSQSDKNSKVHSSTDSKSPMVGDVKSKVHECQICFKVMKSGQALGGHMRSHSMGYHKEQRIKNEAIQVPKGIDLNLPASDTDE